MKLLLETMVNLTRGCAGKSGVGGTFFKRKCYSLHTNVHKFEKPVRFASCLPAVRTHLDIEDLRDSDMLMGRM